MVEMLILRKLEGRVRRFIAAAVLLMVFVGSAGCVDLLTLPPPPTETPLVLTKLPRGAIELSFETLGRDYSGALLSIRGPALVVVAEKAENAAWDDFLYSDTLDRLRESPHDADLDSYFVLGAFQGYRGCMGPTTQIRQIIRQDVTVHVYAYFTEMLPQEPCQTQATSPFHLVKVRKEGTWNSEFTFFLYDNDRLAVEAKHFAR